MNISEHIQAIRAETGDRVIPQIVCADGFYMSVQASQTHYCTPRDNFGPWEAVEIGFPSDCEEAIMPYAENPAEPTETVYAYVPVRVVSYIIDKHGGIKA